MAYEVSSPNMGLPIPGVGQTTGPQFATDVNNCLTLVDVHDHSSGKGVQVTPAGLNINSNLPINSNNLTSVGQVLFTALGGVASTLASIFVVGKELYYNDTAGAHVQLTLNGGVNGTPGSIANLTSPATASYVSANATFVWQSDVTTPANLDAASVILRNLLANSKGLTLSPPAAMGADITITLPSIPASQSFMTLDATGAMAAPYALNTIITPTGVISAYGGTSAPTGYLMCDGSSVLRASYAALFSAIGTAYGTADGTHFNVPDLRGQFLRGVTGSAATDPDASSRTASAAGGNTANNVGSVQAFAFQFHDHYFNIAGNSNPSGNTSRACGGSGGADITLTGFSTLTAGPVASNQTTETRPTNVYVNFIIKT